MTSALAWGTMAAKTASSVAAAGRKLNLFRIDNIRDTSVQKLRKSKANNAPKRAGLIRNLCDLLLALKGSEGCWFGFFRKIAEKNGAHGAKNTEGLSTAAARPPPVRMTNNKQKARVVE